MSNVAYANFGAVQQPMERRVADTDDGYTRIANELLESIASADLTARQLKVLLAITRKTYGFGKKTDRIADEQLAGITGLSRQNVNKAKKELISMNCLLMDGSKIGINKEVSAWNFSKSLQVSNLVSKAETNKVSKLETNGVSNLETHKRNSLKKKETPISPEGNLPVAEEKPKRQTVSKYHFDRDRLKDTWNRKAETFGLPKILSISATTEKGIKRLFDSHLKHCKETGRPAQQIDTFVNGYIEFGYQPTEWACGANPSGKKYGIDTALTQKKIDEIISQEA